MSDIVPPDTAPAPLPTHIEQTLAAIGRLHDRHREGATAAQRAVETTTAFAARAPFAVILALILLIWVAGNLIMKAAGLPPFDPPPFNGLQAVASVLAVFLTVFILATQRRERELSELRQQLTLQLAMLSDQKSAKLIALIEELRVDTPSVRNRRDHEAEALAAPADPEAVLEALRGSGPDMSAGAGP